MDGIRGICAIIIVIYHWGHFLYIDSDFNKELLPLHHYLKWIYSDGWRVVNFFFCLSGFIFFSLYKDQIVNNKISLKYFCIIRLSRLYPLHFLTMLFSLLLNWIYYNINLNDFCYVFNDFKHFLLNLFLANSIGIENGFSYNIPAWSISVEIVLYMLFFLLCRYRLTNSIVLILIISYSYFSNFEYGAITRGVESFFIGGITYKVFNRIKCIGSMYIDYSILVLFFTILIFLPINYFYQTTYNLYSFMLKELSIDPFEKDVIGGGILVITQHSFEFIVFPLTILTLSLFDQKFSHVFKHFKPLGDASYAIYLLHFPMQIFIAILITYFGIPKSIYFSIEFLTLFIATLLLLSRYMFLFYEMPLRNYIRNHFL